MPKTAHTHSYYNFRQFERKKLFVEIGDVVSYRDLIVSLTTFQIAVVCLRCELLRMWRKLQKLSRLRKNFPSPETTIVVIQVKAMSENSSNFLCFASAKRRQKIFLV